MQFPSADALGYANLCEGRVDIVLQCHNKIWDIHPLIPIISAASGIATTWDNRDAKLGGSVLISTNKKVHKHFLKLLKPAL
jgi:myo-inositol-1(or 4)-monophosphatase